MTRIVIGMLKTIVTVPGDPVTGIPGDIFKMGQKYTGEADGSGFVWVEGPRSKILRGLPAEAWKWATPVEALEKGARKVPEPVKDESPPPPESVDPPALPEVPAGETAIPGVDGGSVSLGFSNEPPRKKPGRPRKAA